MKIQNLKNNINKTIEIEAQVASVKNVSGKILLELKDNTGKIKAFSRKNLNFLPGQNIRLLVKIHTNNEIEIISKVKDMDFLIDSDNLKKLEKEYRQAADEIKNALKSKRQIIIRHHDDTDGYTAGYVLEKSIVSILNSDKPHQFYSRKACRTPFYDYIDALVDLNYYLSAKK